MQDPDPRPIRSFSSPLHIRSLCFFSNFNKLVTGYEDGSAQVWSLEPGMEEGSPMAGHSKAVTSLAVVESGSKVVTGAAHKTLYLTDLRTEEATTEVLRGHTQTVKCVAVHPSGDYIASGGGDKILRIWDSDACVQIFCSGPLQGAITHTVFSPNGRWIITTSGTRLMSLWRAEDLGIDCFTPQMDDDPMSSDPLDTYFARYPGFYYDPKEPSTSEFY
ncbi:hypothetical protein CVT26_004689, partial [Gymnopilus dilepis]